MLHGKERRLEPNHAADLTGPQATGVDDVLTVHCRLVLVGAGVVDGEVPATVGSAGDVPNPRVTMCLGTAVAGALEVGVGDLARVEVTLVSVPHRTDEVLRIEDRQEFLGLFGGDQFGLHAEVPATGMAHLEPVHALGRVRKHHTASDVHRGIHPRFLLDLLVQRDRVLLELGDVGVAVERVHAARRVPGGTGGVLGTLEEHDVGPAQLGEVVQDGGADDATADDDDLGVGLHDCAFSILIARWSEVLGWDRCQGRPPRSRHRQGGPSSRRASRWSCSRRACCGTDAVVPRNGERAGRAGSGLG